MLCVFLSFLLAFDLTKSQCVVYSPPLFVGETILPTDATNQLGVLLPDTDTYCTTNDNINWAEGLENALSTATDPQIDYDFFLCKTGLYTEGYILLDSNSGVWLDGSRGITVGGGVDLSTFSRADLQSFGVSTTILDKVDTFLSSQGFLAALNLCSNGPLDLTDQETLDITYAVIDNYYIPTVRDTYNNARDASSTPWEELSLCYRTVLTYLFYEFSNLFSETIWQNILQNQWNDVITELRTYSCSGSTNYCVPLKTRLYQLSNLLETCQPCGNQVDLVFLVDASGSVSTSEFVESLEFIADVVESVANGTQIGLSQFASSYITEFTMNTHNLDTASGRAAAIIDILNTVKLGGGTSLAYAISQLALAQFSDGSGVRDLSELVPRVAIILTDGRSGDDPSTTVNQLTDLGVTVFAIGIGGYDENQLLSITSEEYVFFLDDFDDLVLIIDRISLVSCDVSAELDTGGDYSDVIEVTVGIIQRYRLGLPFRRRLQSDDSVIIRVRQTQGCVYVYSSYCSEYPDQFNNDFAHEACDVTNKTLVIPYTAEVLAGLPCTPTVVNIAVEGIAAGTENLYAVASEFCSSVNDANCIPGVNYVFDNQVTNQTLPDGTLILNTNKVCVSVNETTINPALCVNRTIERDCLGYFGYCNFIDFVSDNPTIQPTANPSASPSGVPTVNPTMSPSDGTDPSLCEGRCWTGESSVCSCSLDCKRPSGNYCCEDYEDICIESLSSKCQRRYNSAYDNAADCYQRKKKSKWQCNNDLQITLLTLAARCDIPTEGMGGSWNS